METRKPERTRLCSQCGMPRKTSQYSASDDVCDFCFEKPCKECGVTKPLTQFIMHSNYADKHTNICKECTTDKYKHGVNRQIMGKLDEIIEKLNKISNWIDRH